MKKPRVEFTDVGGCSPASSTDSRGPGWYCCQGNRYNPASRSTCMDCGHARCDVVTTATGSTTAVVTTGWPATVRAARAAGFVLPKGPGARAALVTFCRSAGIPVPGDPVSAA